MFESIESQTLANGDAIWICHHSYGLSTSGYFSSGVYHAGQKINPDKELGALFEALNLSNVLEHEFMG